MYLSIYFCIIFCVYFLKPIYLCISFKHSLNACLLPKFLDCWVWINGSSSWRSAEVSGVVLFTTTTLFTSCPGFLLRLVSPSDHSSFVPLFKLKAPSVSRVLCQIRRACLESKQRRTKPFKTSPGRSLKSKIDFHRLNSYFSE